MLRGLGQTLEEDLFGGAPAPPSGAFDTTAGDNLPTLYVAPGAISPGSNLGNQSNLVYESFPGQYSANSYNGGVASSAASSGGSSLWTALTAALMGAGNILGARYAVPQLNPGQVISTNATGTTMYQLAPGQTSLPGGLTNIGNTLTSALPLLLIAGVAIALVSAMNKK